VIIQIVPTKINPIIKSIIGFYGHLVNLTAAVENIGLAVETLKFVNVF